jgi:hypothetical protein
MTTTAVIQPIVRVRAWRVIASVVTAPSRMEQKRFVTYYSRDEAMRARDTLLAFGCTFGDVRVVGLLDGPAPRPPPEPKVVPVCGEATCIESAHVICQCPLCGGDQQAGAYLACAAHVSVMSVDHDRNLEGAARWRPLEIE